MRVVVVTPPAGAVITTAQAKDHLNVFTDDDDALIDSYIAAVTAHLDDIDTGWLGRSLGLRTLECRLGRFGHAPIVLPFPPLVALESVKYVDVDGVEQTLADDAYELLGTELDRAWNRQWPQVRRQREAVRIRYTAGYADGQLHPSIYAAMLLMVADLYANRETVLTGTRAAAVEIPMSTTVDRLLTPVRIW